MCSSDLDLINETQDNNDKVNETGDNLSNIEESIIEQIRRISKRNGTDKFRFRIY